METKTIIFIGPQGSGKGTQIEMLVEKLRQVDTERSVVDIQTGRRFRALAARGEGYTERHVARTLDSGVLQPLFLSVSLWADAMREHLNRTDHVLIDGFPRTVAEAQVLDTALSFYQRQQVDIINLDTPEEVVRQRMVERARSDDTDDSIEARLDWYRTEVLPVLDYYRQREHTVVHDIDGTDSIEGVFQQINDVLHITHGTDS